jgi:hypothetical protein
MNFTMKIKKKLSTIDSLITIYCTFLIKSTILVNNLIKYLNAINN